MFQSPYTTAKAGQQSRSMSAEVAAVELALAASARADMSARACDAALAIIQQVT